MPLYSAGLCDAETTAPACTPRSAVRKATPGVVQTPARRASPPAEQTPAARAASRNSPDARGSRPTTIPGRLSPRSVRAMTAARPNRKARSPVRSRLATPRTPSVPNNLPMIGLSYGQHERPRAVDRSGATPGLERSRPIRTPGAGVRELAYPRGDAGEGPPRIRGHPRVREGREPGPLSRGTRVPVGPGGVRDPGPSPGGRRPGWPAFDRGRIAPSARGPWPKRPRANQGDATA